MNRRSAVLTGLVLGAILGGGAQAAQPSAIEALVGEVAGVVGSGDALSLQLRTDTGQRLLKIGEDYRDGWTLKALTPSRASLARDGEIREVGLNPTGDLAAAGSAAPSLVTVTLDERERARLKTLVQTDRWDGKPMPGLTQAETERYILTATAFRANADAIKAPTVGPAGEAAQRAFLGEALYEQQAALSQRVIAAQLDQLRAAVAANPSPLPRSFALPADSNLTQVIHDATADQPLARVEVSDPDAQGARTVTVIPRTTVDPMLAMARQLNWELVAARTLVNQGLIGP